MRLEVDGVSYEARPGREGWAIDGEPAPLVVTSRKRRGESWEFEARQGARRVRWWASPLAGGAWAISTPGGERRVVAPADGPAGAGGPHGPVKSPMAGVLTRLAVAPGQLVAAGETLAVIEAMKMRYEVAALAGGIVAEVATTEGVRVVAGQVLLHLVPGPVS